MSVDTPLLQANDLKKSYITRSPLGFKTGEIRAVNGFSLELHEGETYGLVGESGCGKSTTGRLLQGLIEPTAGGILYRGSQLSGISKQSKKAYRSDVQMIFQDPYSSLNPRRRVGQILAEALHIQGEHDASKIRQKMIETLDAVGFSEEHAGRYPHEFSGGQRQRICIARALMVSPKIIICDEPVSALDVSIQSQILNLLRKLQRELNLSFLFISHDLSVVKYVASRVGVMYLGTVVEEAPTEQLYASPKHPYTQALLAAVPIERPNQRKKREILQGDVPSPLNPPSGCVFRTRCPAAMEVCASQVPLPTVLDGGRTVSCHLYTQSSKEGVAA